MTRARWTGLAGIAFGLALFLGGIGGSTPNSEGKGAAARYADYWNSDSNQTTSLVIATVMTYVFLLLLAFAAGLRQRLRAVDAGPLPTIVLIAGTAAAVLIEVGTQINKSMGVTAHETDGFAVDGKTALVFENLSYQVLAPALMAAAVMAGVTALVTLRTRVLPVWTAWLGFLVALSAVGSFFSAWTGFLLFPLWTVAVGIALMMDREAAPADTVVRESALAT